MNLGPLYTTETTSDNILGVKLNYSECCFKEAAEFQESLLSELPDDLRGIIVDFRDVEVIDSGFISAILSLNKRAKRKNIKLVICNLQPAPKNTLGYTNIDQVITVTDNLEAALATLRGEATS